jgi:hypothetical protein
MPPNEPTYGKLPSPGFMRRNPNYKVAEHKLEGPREKRPEPGSNQDVFNLMNERGLSRDEAEYAAADLRARGTRTGFGGKGVEPNRNLSPRERRQLGLDKNQSSAPTGPTDDQRKWAKSFRDSQPRTPQKSSTPSSGGGSFLGAAARNFRTAVGIPSSPVAAPEKPLNFSRSALVEGAKKSGDFVKTQNDFNKQSAAAQTGERMDRNGGITTLDKKTAGADGLTPYAREKFGPAVEDKAAQRDFATGKSTTTTGTTGMAQQDNGARPTQAQDFRREITSKYGTGSNVARTPGQGGSTMVDPLTGKSVPMAGALADQSAVQKTKEPGSTSGDGYFDPKKIREGVRQRGRVA